MGGAGCEGEDGAGVEEVKVVGADPRCDALLAL